MTTARDAPPPHAGMISAGGTALIREIATLVVTSAAALDRPCATVATATIRTGAGAPALSAEGRPTATVSISLAVSDQTCPMSRSSSSKRSRETL